MRFLSIIPVSKSNAASVEYFSGCRDYSSGSVNFVGGNGNCWLSAPYGEYYGHQLYLNMGGLTTRDGSLRCFGFSVRPLLTE